MAHQGHVLYMGTETLNTNFNYFLEDFGISVNSDSICRIVYGKYHHPKEVMVVDGILNREINRAAGKKIGDSDSKR
jgi:intraflagellar transport protein 52